MVKTAFIDKFTECHTVPLSVDFESLPVGFYRFGVQRHKDYFDVVQYQMRRNIFVERCGIVIDQTTPKPTLGEVYELGNGNRIVFCDIPVSVLDKAS